jgi:gamma-D-glutamyl-L-lysine dipeptidyl-peptidase
LNHRICHLSVIPVRKEASDKSEIISQMLFGELAVEEAREKQWLRVRCLYDDYVGWVDEKQVKAVSEKYIAKLNPKCGFVSLDISQPVLKDDKGFPIVLGSSLPYFDGLTLNLEKDKFVYNGLAIDASQVVDPAALVEKFALKYLYSPYLWGGRSPFGIDCSGFTQMVYKLLGIPIKRDAYQQVDHGSTVDFVETSRPGDLAFFSKEDGKITHVGIVMKNRQVIHASGFVRMDKLDNTGIYHQELKKYTHQLKIIKRLF